MVEAPSEVVRARIVRLKDDDELVAADASDGIGLANDRQQPTGGLAQDEVASVMAVGVVHALEAVEVDKGDGERETVAFGACQTGVEQFGQEPAVGQPGEWIV